jgi:peptidoglycan/LPS O-acetylase OafA/YrhL
MYAGAVLPFTKEDYDNINKHITTTEPSIVHIEQDLDHYIKVGYLGVAIFFVILFYVICYILNKKIPKFDNLIQANED